MDWNTRMSSGAAAAIGAQDRGEKRAPIHRPVDALSSIHLHSPRRSCECSFFFLTCSAIAVVNISVCLEVMTVRKGVRYDSVSTCARSDREADEASSQRERARRR